LQDLIAGLNLFLRGWGNYFRTGNAAKKFRQLDRYVAWRLKRLLRRPGRCRWGFGVVLGESHVADPVQAFSICQCARMARRRSGWG